MLGGQGVRRARFAGVLLLVVALLAACGSTPTQEVSGQEVSGQDVSGQESSGGEQSTGAGSTEAQEARSEPASDDATDDPLAAITAELDGLDGDERTERLAELAREGGRVQFYTSMTDQLAEQLALAFEDRHGVAVDIYRAPSSAILQRILQEVTSGAASADVVEFTGPEIVALQAEDALLDYDSPAIEGLAGDPDRGAWITSRLAVYAPAWNTAVVDEPPTTWEELADPRWDGRLGMESTNAEWYMALSLYWAEQGHSEEQIDQLWADIARGTLMVQGHSPLRQLLIAEEFVAVPSLYTYMVEESAANGAPLAWQPPVTPQIVGANGTGVVRNTANPAGAMLFIDWLLTDGQELILAGGIEPTRADLQQLDPADTFPIDVDRFFAEQQQWVHELEQLTTLGEPAPQS